MDLVENYNNGDICRTERSRIIGEFEDEIRAYHNGNNERFRFSYNLLSRKFEEK